MTKCSCSLNFPLSCKISSISRTLSHCGPLRYPCFLIKGIGISILKETHTPESSLSFLLDDVTFFCSADGVKSIFLPADRVTSLSLAADGVLFLFSVIDRATPLSFSGDGDSLAADGIKK